MKDVKQVIVEMMQENTGKALCDSGDAYGRNWEKNQKIKDFDSLPDVTWEVYDNEITFSVNVYHYLSSVLEVDEICEKFNKLNIGKDWNCKQNVYGVCQEAYDYISGLGEVSEPFNSYNNESCLSQILQGSRVTIDGDDYFILQLHNGCDVRGGYTDARLFKQDYWSVFKTNPDVYGVIDGVEVSTGYNGWSLTDDSGNDVEINKDSKVELWACLDY